MKLVGKIDYESGVKINPLGLDFGKFTAPQCDHCKTNHKRKYTYIVELDNGDLIQVGKGCLDKVLGKDFNYDAIAYDSQELLEYLVAGYNPKERAYSVRELLYVLIQFNKTYGLDNKNFNDYYQDINFVKSIDTKDRDYSEVETIIEWYKSVKLYNDFQNNVKNLVLMDYVESRYINYFKYAYKVYLDNISYKAQYNSVLVDYTQTTIKSVEMVNTKAYTYGYRSSVETKVYRIIDTDSNVFEYETSSNIALSVGDKIKFKHKGTYASKKYGVVNKINYVRII